MKIKKFNESSEFINYYKFSMDNKFYYGVANPDGTNLIYDAYGEFIEEGTISDEIKQIENTITKIEYKDLPKEIVDALEAEQPTDEEVEDRLNDFRGEIEKDKMLQPKERTYADMSQKELNDLINQAIDSGDFVTAQEISQFMGESKVFKFNEKLEQELADHGGITQEEYKEIIDFVHHLSIKADTDENPFKNKLVEEQGELTDEEKTLSEILWNIIKHPERGYDYDTHYHRRLGYIKGNKNKKD